LKRVDYTGECPLKTGYQ